MENQLCSKNDSVWICLICGVLWESYSHCDDSNSKAIGNNTPYGGYEPKATPVM